MTEEAKPVQMTDAELKAFDFTQETTKQLLTLATAIFALTLTFVTDIANTQQAKNVIEWLHVGWGGYILSIVFGVGVLLTLEGNLERPNDGEKPSIYANNITWMMRLQIGSFAVALIFTAIFGFKAI